MSNPIVTSSSPRAEAIKPLSGLFPASDDIIVSPKTPSAKYSYDSKERATLARGTENRIRMIVPTRPPTVEAVSEVRSAYSGFPCFVSS